MTETGEADPISYAVVQAVADATREDVTEIPPLYETIDADALETLCESNAISDMTVTFAYYGFRVTVTGDGNVTLSSRSGEGERGTAGGE